MARYENKCIEATKLLNLPNVLFHQLDVQDAQSIQSLATFIETEVHILDILINNVGASGVVVDGDGLRAKNIDSATWVRLYTARDVWLELEHMFTPSNPPPPTTDQGTNN
ncbi:hypothetical protein ACS0TY_000583 [Phlomoides rotata]